MNLKARLERHWRKVDNQRRERSNLERAIRLALPVEIKEIPDNDRPQFVQRIVQRRDAHLRIRYPANCAHNPAHEKKVKDRLTKAFASHGFVVFGEPRDRADCKVSEDRRVLGGSYIVIVKPKKTSCARRDGGGNA